MDSAPETGSTGALAPSGVACVGEHLDEVRHLAVGAEELRAFDDADDVVGELLLKLMDGGDSGI